jgi:hypothetical protein
MAVSLHVLLTIVTMEDLYEDHSSDDEAYSSDDEAKVEDPNLIHRRGTLIEKKVKPKVKHEEEKDRHNVIGHGDISVDLRTDKSGNFKCLAYVDKAIYI